jgi:hypothetical protein
MSSAKQFLKSLAAGMRRETWWFTDHELARTVRGPEDTWGHDPFVAYLRDAAQGVVVLRNGQVTDAWEDGEHGVPPAIQHAAGQVQEVSRPTEYGENWAVDEADEKATERRPVLVDADDRFAGFVGVTEGRAKDFLRSLPSPEAAERWCFTEYELEHPHACRGDDEFCADVGEALLVIVLRNGQVTDRWEDGTVGVSPHLQDLADFQEVLYKRDRRFPGDPSGTNIVGDTWRKVIVRNEEFVDWLTGTNPQMEGGAKQFLKSLVPAWVRELHEMGWKTGHAESYDVRQFTLSGFYVRNNANPTGRIVLYVSKPQTGGFVASALHDEKCFAPPIGVYRMPWPDLKSCLAHWQKTLEFTLPEEDDSKLPSPEQWEYSWNELRKHLKARTS